MSAEVLGALELPRPVGPTLQSADAFPSLSFEDLVETFECPGACLLHDLAQNDKPLVVVATPRPADVATNAQTLACVPFFRCLDWAPW